MEAHKSEGAKVEPRESHDLPVPARDSARDVPPANDDDRNGHHARELTANKEAD